MTLPTDLDTTYADDPGDASVKAHQQHHDEIHAKLNGIEVGADVTDATNVAAAGGVLSDGSVTHVVALTQAAYDVLTPDAQTLYFITDAA